MKMKELLIATQTGGTFDECTNDKEQLFKSFKMVKDCGFEAVDYNLDHFVKGNTYEGRVDDFWKKSLEELYEYFAPTKEAAEENGIAFAQAHVAFPMYLEGKDEFNEYMLLAAEKNLAICKYLGSPALIVHPIVMDDREKREGLNLAMYRKLIPAAKKYGVKICLENLMGLFRDRPIQGVCSTTEEACMYIDTLNEEAGEELFGFCFDTGHANVVGINMREFIKKMGKRLICLHLHENDRVYDEHIIPFTHVCPGLDWESVIAGLQEVGYRGAISFETFTGVRLMPQDVKPEVLRLISAIGRYLRKRITE